MFYSLLMQEMLSSSRTYPVLQAHSKEPSVLMQIWSQPFSSTAHSSTSVIVKTPRIINFLLQHPQSVCLHFRLSLTNQHNKIIIMWKLWHYISSGCHAYCLFDAWLTITADSISSKCISNITSTCVWLNSIMTDVRAIVQTQFTFIHFHFYWKMYKININASNRTTNLTTY